MSNPFAYDLTLTRVGDCKLEQLLAAGYNDITIRLRGTSFEQGGENMQRMRSDSFDSFAGNEKNVNNQFGYLPFGP